MFYGYCFTSIDGPYTPKVHLPDAEAAFRYCTLQHQLFPEVRITDEDDFCVMHVRNHVLKIPYPEGHFRYFHLREQREATEDEQF